MIALSRMRSRAACSPPRATACSRTNDTSGPGFIDLRLRAGQRFPHPVGRGPTPRPLARERGAHREGGVQVFLEKRRELPELFEAQILKRPVARDGVADRAPDHVV